MSKNEFELAFNEIKSLRALPQDVILEALRTALVSAYRRFSGASAAQAVEAIIDPVTGRMKILVEKEVVESIISPQTEVLLEKARYYNPEAQLYDTVMVEVEGSIKKFGRIAAQTAKQVILQKIREAERAAVYLEFSEREGDVVNATVQNVMMHKGEVTLTLGRAEATMPKSHQIPNEQYRPHDKLRVYVVDVKPDNKGPKIVVSRSHRNMLKRLLEIEVPEIYNGQVEIKSIAREAGARSKVAVAALQEGIDPVGACVGMRGMRIQNIVRELHDEKIDVIEWQIDPKRFISAALSPARVSGVYLEDDFDDGRTAVVMVPEDQLSLAIGREGQNARLAAKLTGWRIDIKSEPDAVSTALANLDRAPYDHLKRQSPTMVADAQRILEKRVTGKVVMPEELGQLSRFANQIELLLHETRGEERQARLAEIEAVKATIPEPLFGLPVARLNAGEEVIEKLESLGNIGEIMWRFLIDEQRIAHLLRGLPESAFEQVKAGLDELMMAAMMGELDMTVEAAPEPAYDEASPIEFAQAHPEVALSLVNLPASIEDDDEIDAPLFPVDEEAMAASATGLMEVGIAAPATEVLDPEEEERRARKAAAKKARPEGEFDEEDPEFGEAKKKGKAAKKNREMVFDEESGRVVAKRKRKRTRDEWDDY
ncbi:MAG: transcription termination factor NusA [Phototrophicaceae bacterium]|jgi:N utilization substance protein A